MKPATLVEIIESAEREYADKTAFIYRPRFRALRFTYGELGAMARKFACLLESKGILKGDRVIIWAANSPYWVAAFYGCQMLGAVAVPLMVQNTFEFVSKIADITRAKLIIKSEFIKAANMSIPTVDIDTALAVSDLAGSFSPGNPTPDDVAQILFTSGTTGNPKGVVLKHRNIIANAMDIVSLNIVTQDDHLMSFLPLAHVFEQMASIFVGLSLGITITQAASLSGHHIRLNMEEDRPTVLTSVPEFLKLTLERIEGKAEQEGRADKLRKLFDIGHKLPPLLRRRLAAPILERLGGRLRLIVSGGSALSPEIEKKWEALGICVLQGYGATETSPVVTINRYDSRRPGSVGLPLPSVKVRLAEDGEVLVNGPNVAEGYYERPRETSNRFRDGWYYTDDLGEFDSAGRLYIKGRKKFLIVTPAGENVYPEDIEEVLNSEEDVRDSAVIAVTRGGRFEIHAVLLLRSGSAPVDYEAIIDRVNGRLQPHQRVQGVSIWPMDDFPRTVTRKVKKNDVWDWVENRGRGGPSSVSPVSVSIVEVAISQATGIASDAIRPEMRLEADLKMDSLGRVTLAGIIEEEVGLALDDSQLSPDTTVAELRDILASRKQTQERYEFNPAPLTARSLFIRKTFYTCFTSPLLSMIALLQTDGIDNLDGIPSPVLFYPNHISPIDAGPALKAMPTRFRDRLAIASAADVLYDDTKISRFSRALEMLVNIYPFSREAQVKSSLIYTGRLLDRGFSVMLFPEGRISMDGNLGGIKGGAGLIAVEMGVPVIPIGIAGTDRIVPPDADRLMMPRRSRVAVVFGKPLLLGKSCCYDDAAKAISIALKEASEKSKSLLSA